MLSLLRVDSSKAVRDLVDEVHSLNLLLMGDFNYPDIDWSSNQGRSPAAQLFVGWLDDGFLTQHVQAPIRGKSCLDLVISSDPDIVTDLEILGLFPNSDHNMIRWSVAVNTQSTDSRRHVFEYNKANFDADRKSV